MTPSDVLIIGGGPGGLTCAITLASASSKPWFGDRTITVLDDGRSDLHRACLNNAPGIEPGTRGSDVLKRMRRQFLDFEVGAIHHAHVTSLTRDPWCAHCDEARTFVGDRLVLTTGYKYREIEGLPGVVAPHHPEGKPGRIAIRHDGLYSIADHAHVAGVLAGGSSQFAIAAGIGAQVAVELLCEWAGKRTHVHDTPLEG